MQLGDLENLLGIKVDDAQKPMYEARLGAAIDQASEYCNRDFKNDAGQLALPNGAKMGVAMLVKAMGENPSVQHQGLGDMSKSFFKNGTLDAARSYLKPYRRAGFK